MTNSERYLEESLAGEGGTAAVFKAYDRELDRHVALKRVKDTRALEGELTELVSREARLLAALEHPNIVPVHDVGIDAHGRRFYTMKLLAGERLSDRLARNPPAHRAPGELLSCLRIVIAVCDALDFAHARSILHLDVKSENVMVGDHGEVHLIDWGISKMARQPDRITRDRARQAARGRQRLEPLPCTPSFASPEQAQGRADKISCRTDVFGVGALLFEIATGSPPFEAPSANEALVAASCCEFEGSLDCAPALPAWLRQIIVRAMAREPEHRYESVKALKQDLQGFVDNVWKLNRCAYAQGDVIIRQDEPATTVFLIIAGRCEVVRTTMSGQEKQVAILGPGDVFGELALVHEGRRTAMVRALDAVEVAVLDREKLRRDLAGNLWMGRLLPTLVNRILDKDRRLTELEQRRRALVGALDYLATQGQRLADGRLAGTWSGFCHSMEGTMDVAFLPGAMGAVLLEWIAAASGARPERLDSRRIRSGSFVIDFQTDQYWIGAAG
ncbi:MAG TPA: serine/threonine-protein kinase [Polyangia bacterium]|jgi:Serine/threonine protein kinase|nr:serine/threonine-protein kinase [Polyangia bacterium]